MKEIQAASLEILRDLAQLCDELGLRYSLIYGTLLGAIRHGGFIPWDDDLDVMMPRPDYDALLEYLMNNPDRFEHYSIFNPQTSQDYPYMITRISDDRYVIETDNEKSYGLGVFIDVYPYDGLGTDERAALRLGRKGDVLSSLCFQASRRKIAIGATNSRLKFILKIPAFFYAHLIGRRAFQKKLGSLANQLPYEESDYIGCIVWLSGGKRDIFEKKWFDELINVPFEQYEFKVPAAYDEILRHAYGNYMELPPVNERIGHHFYRAYRRGE